MNLNEAEIAWLKRWELVDSEVDLDSVELHVGGAMGLYLRITKHGALTIGRSIWFRTQKRRDDIDLLVHELVHVGQYQRRGRFGFLRRYLGEIVRRRGYSRDHSMEAPAYGRQERAREIVKEHGGPGRQIDP
jgi:uncharacterized protein DUF4157